MGTRKSLVIIESPAKARSLRSYLGKEYDIEASNGHVRDLPRNYLGVNDDFKPTYAILPEKRKTVTALKKKALKYDRIYLAADPDREGEAICWHLSMILARKGVTFSRLRFNAITRETVLKALKKPSRIDMQLVDAQQARRVMDRLVGYKVSAWLQRIMGKGKSAGRVQSVALRIIQEREDSITGFKPVEYWTVSSEFTDGTGVFTMDLSRIDGKTCCKPGKPPSDEGETDKILRRLSDRSVKWRVTDVKSSTRSVKPPPPFITSSLQQAASNRLSFSPSRTMTLAQQLYEGVQLEGNERTGLITYMRTDSVRMSPESLSECREYLAERFGEEELHSKPRRYRSSKGSQDAHEAIRPSSIRRTPESLRSFLTKPQLSLYSLIWNRFAATQLKNASVRKTTAVVSGDGMEFQTSGENLVEPGFSRIDPAFIRLSRELPPISKGDVELKGTRHQQKFTKPPSRFTEAKLVAEMKKVGIGRPSTYVSTIKTLLKRQYIEIESRSIRPTEMGTKTVEILTATFPHIFQIDFTARMEDLLDDIARGRESYESVLEELNRPLQASLHDARQKTEKLRQEMEEETGEKCPKCASPMVIKWGRFGKFMACSAFPKCKFSRPVEAPEEEVFSGRSCPRCGGRLLVKKGRYGRYLGCEKNPECRHTQPLPTGVRCPVEGCDGELVEKRTRKGRVFYGCSSYPECQYAVWNYPLGRNCPRCGFPVLVKKKKGIWCPSCKKKISD